MVPRPSRRPWVSPESASSRRGNPTFVPGSNPLLLHRSAWQVVKPFGFRPTGCWNISMVRNPNSLRTRPGADTTPQNLLLLTGSGLSPRKPQCPDIFWWETSWTSRLLLPACRPAIFSVQPSPRLHRPRRLLRPHRLLRLQPPTLPLRPKSRFWRQASCCPPLPLPHHLCLRVGRELGARRSERVIQERPRVVRSNVKCGSRPLYASPRFARAHPQGEILPSLCGLSQRKSSAQQERWFILCSRLASVVTTTGGCALWRRTIRWPPRPPDAARIAKRCTLLVLVGQDFPTRLRMETTRSWVNSWCCSGSILGMAPSYPWNPTPDGQI
jgi:hypothetical protein